MTFSSARSMGLPLCYTLIIAYFWGESESKVPKYQVCYQFQSVLWK